MASREFTLTVTDKKSDIAAADAGSASGNVIVYIDNAEHKANVVAALTKVIEYIVEKEY